MDIDRARVRVRSSKNVSKLDVHEINQNQRKQQEKNNKTESKLSSIRWAPPLKREHNKW